MESVYHLPAFLLAIKRKHNHFHIVLKLNRDLRNQDLRFQSCTDEEQNLMCRVHGSTRILDAASQRRKIRKYEKILCGMGSVTLIKNHWYKTRFIVFNLRIKPVDNKSRIWTRAVVLRFKTNLIFRDVLIFLPSPLKSNHFCHHCNSTISNTWIFTWKPRVL